MDLINISVFAAAHVDVDVANNHPVFSINTQAVTCMDNVTAKEEP